MSVRTSLVLAAGLFFATSPSYAGDRSDEIVQIAPDTYILTRTSKAGIFASMAKLKAGVIRDANAFAAKQGKIAVVISARETPVGGPGQWPMFEYQFRVVSEDDPEARRTSLVPRPDVVIEDNKNIKAEIKTIDQTPKERDIYNELIKLDDLHKKGILTDAEFEAEKAKVLSGS